MLGRIERRMKGDSAFPKSVVAQRKRFREFTQSDHVTNETHQPINCDDYDSLSLCPHAHASLGSPTLKDGACSSASQANDLIRTKCAGISVFRRGLKSPWFPGPDKNISSSEYETDAVSEL